MTTYNTYPVINNIILFYRKEFSQWHGALSDGLTAPFKIDISDWNPFFRHWMDYDEFLTEFDVEFTDDFWDGYQHTFTTAEHAMMFGKAIIFRDWNTANQILTTVHPKDVKDLGRQVKNYEQSYWDKVKLDLVTMINKQKFSQNTELKELLVKTGQYILAEASKYDSVWGIGLSANHPDAGNVDTWKGQNLLGRALMRVREELV